MVYTASLSDACRFTRWFCIPEEVCISLEVERAVIDMQGHEKTEKYILIIYIAGITGAPDLFRE